MINNRHLSKLAYREKFVGNTERSTAAYVKVREDVSTGLTHKLPLEVEFGKMSNLKLLLQNYSNIYPEEVGSKERMLEFLDKNSLVSSFVNNAIGHFTASAFLLNNDQTKFLLMHHKKLNKWLQLGGHCDGDSDILAAAIREAKEESGINEIEIVSDKIFDIDIHYIPQNRNEPEHYHYDVRFLLKTVDNDNFIKNNESHELKWFSFAGYPQLGIELERSVTRMIEKLKSCLIIQN